jgi:O-antigen/teichoic acid export membrane protein
VAEAAGDRVVHRRILRGAATNSGARLLAYGVWFLLTPFIIATVGTADYGLWALIGSVVGLASLLELGIGGAITKYVAEYRLKGHTETARDLISTALALYLGLAGIIIVAAVLAAPVVPVLFRIAPDQQPLAVALVISMGASAAVTIPTYAAAAALQGLHRYDVVNLVGSVGVLVSAAGTAIALLLGGGILAVVLVPLPISVGVFAADLWYLRSLAPDLSFRMQGVSRIHVRRVLSFSASIFVARIAGQLKAETDEVVIGFFLPVSAVAHYTVARRLSQIIRTLAEQLAKVLLPIASELDAARDQDRLRHLYLLGSRLTLVVLLPLSAALIALAGPTLAAWVGPEYVESASVVVVLVISQVFDTSQWPAGYVLQGMNRHRPLAFISLGGALANLLFSVVLVQHYGVLGVAVGTLIPTVIETTLLVTPYAARVLDVTLGRVITDVLLRALLPLAPAIVVLVIARSLIEPTGIVALVAITAPVVAAYALAYARYGATPGERDAYLRPFRFARAAGREP